MIVDNYNNSLPENVESGLTFHTLASPSINIRMFDFNLVRDETHLIIPYCVSNTNHDEYYNEKVGDTFTTVFVLDEDKAPDNDGTWKTWKKTTYAGEQTIDLGVFDEEGIHSLNVRTIQNNGIGSCTKLLRFIVRKPDNENTVLDFSNGTSFNGVLNNYSEYKSYDDSPIYTVCEAVYNARYSVTAEVEDGKVVDICITVEQVGNAGSLVKYKLNDNGSRKSVFSSEDITGTFHIATRCEVNGVMKELSDYVGIPSSEVPENVARTAANNKIGLTRLFEAAKSYGADVIVMPELNIILDYNYGGDSFGDPINETTGVRKFYSRDDVVFPNNIRIDMNNSVIEVLHADGVHVGHIMRLLNNRNTHIVNCDIRGNWRNESFAWRNQGEHRSTIMLEGCWFCSLNNVDVSYTVGYDSCISSIDVTDLAQLAFTNSGYIDYEGTVHDGTSLPNSNEQAYSGFMFTGNSFCNVYSKHTFLTGSDFRIIMYNQGTDGYGNDRTSNRHTLTCRDMFVHFYDSNDDFVKTVKVSERWPILIPYGASKIKVTMWGTTEEGKFDSLSGAGTFCRSFLSLSWGTAMYNCDIHDTRAYTLCNGGVQTVVKNCRLWNITGEYYPSGSNQINYTYNIDNGKHAIDCEDDSHQMFFPVWDNCEILYGDTTSVTLMAGYDAHFKDCHNIHISLGQGVNDCLIERCSGGLYCGYNHSNFRTNIVVRNCIFNNVQNGGGSKPKDLGSTTCELYIRNNSVNRTSGCFENKIHDYKQIKM